MDLTNRIYLIEAVIKKTKISKSRRIKLINGSNRTRRLRVQMTMHPKGNQKIC